MDKQFHDRINAKDARDTYAFALGVFLANLGMVVLVQRFGGLNGIEACCGAGLLQILSPLFFGAADAWTGSIHRQRKHADWLCICLALLAGILYSTVSGLLLSAGTQAPGLFSAILLPAALLHLLVGPLLYGRAFVRFTQVADPLEAPRCPACGYVLYHAKDRRCPDCGRPFGLEEISLDSAAIDEDGTLKPK